MTEAVASTADRERPIGFVGLMRNRNYALLWWGQLVSEVGNRFHWVAVSLWVYSVTGSAGSVSLAVASMFVGSLLVGLWAGVLVDRWDRRKILIVSDLVRGVLVALIPPLMGVSVWLVYADLVLISVATAFFRPAIFAIIPSTVSQQHLLQANSFFNAMDSGTEIFGPALAGVLAFRYGYAPLLYFDAATYLVSAGCMTLLSTGPGISKGSVGLSGRRSIVTEMAEGFRFIRRDSLQWQLFLLIFPAYLVGSGLNALQAPLAKGEVGISDAQFGTFQAFWGVGLVAGSLVLGWLGTGIPKSLTLVGGFLLQFAAAAVMGMSKAFGSLSASAFGVGFGNMLALVSLATILMEATPKEIIGRVISVRQVVLSCVRIVTPIVFGTVGDVVGVRESILILVAIGTAGTLVVALRGPALWGVNSSRGILMSAGRSRLSRLGIDRYSPEFSTTEQIRLNVLTTSLMLIGVGALAYFSLPNAVGFVVSACLAVGFGVFLRHASISWRRRVEHVFDKAGARRTAPRRGTPFLVEPHTSRTDS